MFIWAESDNGYSLDLQFSWQRSHRFRKNSSENVRHWTTKTLTNKLTREYPMNDIRAEKDILIIPIT